MRFAVLADLHIGRSIPLAIAEHRRAAFERALTKAVDAIVAASVDYVFICGDLFERRTLRPHMVEFTQRELYRLANETETKHSKSLRILVVRGNHDGRSQSDALDYIRHPLAGYLHVFGDEDITYRDDRLDVVGLNYYDQIDVAYEKLAKPVNVEFQETTLTKALEFFRKSADLNIILDTGASDLAEKRLTIKLNNIRISTDLPLSWRVEVRPDLIATLEQNQEEVVSIRFLPPPDVSVGDYEPKIRTECIADNRKVFYLSLHELFKYRGDNKGFEGVEGGCQP
jgi:predicted phosphodiesterase